MLFRRRLAKKSPAELTRAEKSPADHLSASRMIRRACVETLESRMMLTAVIDGLFETGGTTLSWVQPNLGDDPLQVPPPPDNVRISISGNLTAEFIGMTPGGQLTDIVNGSFLFAIYIVEADLDCTISFSGLTQPPVVRMDPFLPGPDVRTTTAGELPTVGAAWLGAQTDEDLPDPANNIPIIRATEKAFGMRPASAGNLYAGIETAPGVSIGRIYIGGTVTGLVDIKGDCLEFYANNILTGTANGIGSGATSDIHRNFHVGGDLHNLMALTSFGTNTLVDDAQPNLSIVDYTTGFQLEVGGRLGQVKALDSFLGQAVIRNDERKTGFGVPQSEIETRGPALPPTSSYFDPVFVGNDVAVGNNVLQTLFNNNDTFDNAQWLGTFRSAELEKRSTIQINGNVQGAIDPTDFYAVTVLAGQFIDVQLIDPLQVGTSAGVRLSIFDSDNRLVATDATNINDGTRAGKTIRVKADRPGAYRIAVSGSGDYQLRVGNVGNLALGGLIVENHIGTNDTADKGLQVLRGDLGQVRAGIVGDGTIFSQSDAWYIPAGNLRAIEAATIGIVGPGPIFFLGTGPELLVRKGSIGLLRNTVGGFQLAINDNQAAVASLVSDTAFFPSTAADLSRTPKQLAVGGNIQLVDAAGSLEGALLANGAIGVIRAADVGTVGASFPVWQVNVDGSGSRGTIDLIDVTGTLNAVGMTTGPNGNIRHMRVAGVINRDQFFGGGQPEETVFAPGQIARLTDDSGTQFTITPLPLIRGPFGPGQPEFADPPQVSALGYPIRDKAGQVIVSVTVVTFDDGIAPTFNGGGGVEIETGASGSGGSVEIGTLNLSGTTSNTLTFDPFTREYIVTPVQVTVPIDPPVSQRFMNVEMRGRSRIDIFELAAGAGIYDSIETNGEIVNISGAPDIISLEAETLGLAKSATGTAVEGASVLDSTYPFLQQRNLVTVSDLVSASTTRGMGNIVAANIGTLRANSDGKNVKNVHEGINGPIVARHPAGVSELTGNILDVRVGEGVASSGTGAVGFAGIFADGIIDSVSASGTGNDIRGDIVAGGITNPLLDQPLLDDAGQPVVDAFGNPVLQSTPTFTIGTISVSRGAAIVDADIMVVGDPVAGVGSFEQSAETNAAAFNFMDGPPDTFGEPFNEIGSIEIDGNGGILGAFIVAADIGPISIDKGFGLINSTIFSVGDSVVEGVTTDGYGVRDTLIDGGASLNRIIARGKGKRLDTRGFTSSVRKSEKGVIDDASGMTLTALDDLHLYLGTKASAPKRKGVSEAGMIVDSQFVGSRDLGRVEAFRILARNTTTRDATTGERTPIAPLSPAYPMRISFGSGTNRIVTGDIIDGLSLVTGNLDLLQTGNNVQRTVIRAASRIKNINVQGSLRGTTDIRATGPEGRIDNINVRKNLFSKIIASLDISNVTVGADLGSSSLESSRNINKLSVKRSILTGAFVRARLTLGSLVVGRDIQEGATVRAGEIENQSIGGQVNGDIIIV
jgi:hypothetical protein